MKRIFPVSLHPHVLILWQDTLFPLLQFCSHPVPACVRVTGLVMTAMRGTSWTSKCWTVLLSTYILFNVFERTWESSLSGGIETSPVDEHLHPVVPDEHPPDLLLGALLLCPKLIQCPIVLPRAVCAS